MVHLDNRDSGKSLQYAHCRYFDSVLFMLAFNKPIFISPLDRLVSLLERAENQFGVSWDPGRFDREALNKDLAAQLEEPEALDLILQVSFETKSNEFKLI